jgi:NAD(P)-dependent dehydrogenase (short-subunit alcohol dehydrogenase family)
MDLRDRRIRVNAVSPGFIDTPAWHSTEAGEQHLKMVADSIPIGRVGTPDDIAKAVVFLASDDRSYIAGTELFVGWRFCTSLGRQLTHSPRQARRSSGRAARLHAPSFPS